MRALLLAQGFPVPRFELLGLFDIVKLSLLSPSPQGEGCKAMSKTTIIHWFDFNQWRQRAYVNDPHGNKTERQYQYMLGLTKPNYQMPAIALAFEFYPDTVALIDVHNGRWETWHKD